MGACCTRTQIDDYSLVQNVEEKYEHSFSEYIDRKEKWILASTDLKLAEHYKECGRNDYYDYNGDGKFIKFVREHGMDQPRIDLELAYDRNQKISVNDCLLIKMDNNFPFKEQRSDTNWAILGVLMSLYRDAESCYLVKCIDELAIFNRSHSNQMYVFNICFFQ